MSGHLPLEGLRVLDLASFIAGPVATTVMGDYGAEVIKIEPPRATRSASWARPIRCRSIRSISAGT
jgi:crotonobetainyl-CoA:carnitine CoA-transferase CaiB-like acyl-CoA transferase